MASRLAQEQTEMVTLVRARAGVALSLFCQGT